jgi:hypothetical protein
MHRKKWGSLSKTTLINDPHSNKHISIDSVALCLEQTFCDGYHSATRSLLSFELSTNWARQTEKRDGAIRNFGQSSIHVACAPMRRWLDNLSTRTRVLLTIAVVAVAVMIIECS